MAVGGSMIVGMGCDDRNATPWASSDVTSRACSYPDRFARMLRDAYYHRHEASNFSYINRAVGGTTTGAVLPMIESLVMMPPSAGYPDLLLIDFSVNDELEEQDWGTGFSPDAGEMLAFTRYDKVYAATELLLRHLTDRAPRMAILFIEGSCVTRVCTTAGEDQAAGCWFKSKKLVSEATYPSEMSASQATEDAAKVFGVPYLPYPKLVSSCLNTNLVTHPGAPAHQQIAGATFIWFCTFISRISAAQGQRPPPLLSHPALLERYAVCQEPRSMYDARSLYGANATLLPGPAREDSPKGSWVLAEDRPGKPGWMPTRDGDEIDFPLSFGKAPRATIVYTTGYTQEWGAAVVAMLWAAPCCCR